ncbi:hypothetical protein BLNAU_8778 [Blattamonas nauphoetae]|uniref:Uncharacterized protein n=1 Tax=Blattamonas nauphoetae TaxID=2049346 RepID=A0ABQ9XXK5_9EUKA|nr:hypothetical protein BLNAU_8778 [Blattamonas nauphoetae]
MHHQKMEKGKVLEMDRSRLQTDRHLVPTKRRHREYFNTVRQMEKRKIERLEEQVVQQMTPQKLIFVDEDATQAEIEAIESSTQHEPLHLKSNPSIVAEIEDRKQKLRQAARNAQTLDNHIELTVSIPYSLSYLPEKRQEVSHQTRG